MIQVSAPKDIESQHQLINENFGEQQDEKDKAEKEEQNNQIKYFESKMASYQESVSKLLKNIQSKEDALHDMNDELE